MSDVLMLWSGGAFLLGGALLLDDDPPETFGEVAQLTCLWAMMAPVFGAFLLGVVLLRKYGERAL